MENIFTRFPGLGEAILAHVDNKSLALWRKVDRKWKNFNDNQKTFWIRMIEKHIGKPNTFSEDWKNVLFKTPVEMIKKIGMSTNDFYIKFPNLSEQYSPLFIAT